MRRRGSVVDEIAGDSLEKVATTLKEDVIKPPVVLLLRCILFILLFVLLWIILSLIAKALSKTAKKLPIIKGFNAWCGGFVGIIIGVLLCFAFSALLGFITQINPNGIFGITQITKDNSVVYRFLSDLVQTILK